MPTEYATYPEYLTAVEADTLDLLSDESLDLTDRGIVAQRMLESLEEPPASISKSDVARRNALVVTFRGLVEESAAVRNRAQRNVIDEHDERQGHVVSEITFEGLVDAPSDEEVKRLMLDWCTPATWSSSRRMSKVLAESGRTMPADPDDNSQRPRSMPDEVRIPGDMGLVAIVSSSKKGWLVLRHWEGSQVKLGPDRSARYGDDGLIHFGLSAAFGEQKIGWTDYRSLAPAAQAAIRNDGVSPYQVFRMLGMIPVDSPRAATEILANVRRQVRTVMTQSIDADRPDFDLGSDAQLVADVHHMSPADKAAAAGI